MTDINEQQTMCTSAHCLLFFSPPMMAQLSQMFPHPLPVVVPEALLEFESLVTLPVEAAMMNVSTLMDSALGAR
ncbi:MAG: hypothetical protein IJ513_07975 [Bacteroidaceae bacterium]|nr:hypothetical protein [Bacteroidaceae bacterium]